LKQQKITTILKRKVMKKEGRQKRVDKSYGDCEYRTGTEGGKDTVAGRNSPLGRFGSFFFQKPQTNKEVAGSIEV